jgi:pyruvate dehydrogenase kinase 2/3/4
MPSIKKVKDWYAQSFEELTSIRQTRINSELKGLLYQAQRNSGHTRIIYNNGKEKLIPKQIALRPERGFHGIPEICPTEEDLIAEGFNSNIDLNNGKADTFRRPSSNSRRYYAVVDPTANWPPEIEEYNNDVTSKLQRIKTRHDGVVSTIAQGVLEWKETRPTMAVDYSIQSFLDRFYLSRIGIRMLIGQHIALNMDRGLRQDYVGIICTHTDVKEIALTAVDNARFLCEEWYGLFEAPKVEIVCKSDIKFMYVPGHLNHMLFETIKNSLRAVVETYGVDAESYPPIKVIVAEGQEDITIKVSDEGGGIPRSEVPYVWTYMYTTVKDRPRVDPDLSRSDFKAPMAGYGYGLPISRLYARYFGGDLKLISMEGYGTDVYLHLNRLSSSTEPIV